MKLWNARELKDEGFPFPLPPDDEGRLGFPLYRQRLYDAFGQRLVSNTSPLFLLEIRKLFPSFFLLRQ